MTIQQELTTIEAKLSDLRVRYKASSPALQKFLLVGANLLKERREKLMRDLENEKIVENEMKLF